MEDKLIDFFAAKVLQGVFANNEMFQNMCLDRKGCTRDKANDDVYDYIAQESYKMAEAMIKERKYLENKTKK
jgi:hypothetical protein